MSQTKSVIRQARYEGIKLDILAALKGSSSQQPLAVEVLAARLSEHKLSEIELVLAELYYANQVGWCKIVKHPKKAAPIERVVWWSVGKVDLPACYNGRNGHELIAARKRGLATRGVT